MGQLQDCEDVHDCLFVFFLEWDAPTLHIQGLIQPQVEVQQALCFFQIR